MQVQFHRRGSAYVLVLGVALLVTVMGMGALTLTRVSGKTTAAGSDWEEAGVLALSATEQGMSVINAAAMASPSNWRSSYTSRRTAMTTSLGRGSMSWVLKDEVDGVLAEDYLRPFRLYGIGKVGAVTRIYSVQVTPGGTPLDLLRTGAHASGSVQISGNLSAVNGPISSNAAISLSGTVNGSIEASSTSGNANGTHPITAPAATKTMPQSTLFADLSANATVIDFASIPGSKIQKCLLSSTSNPFGTVNPNGIYSISMSGNQTLTITNCRIVGTLLIDAGNKGQINVQGPVEWETGPVNNPILVVTGTKMTVTFSGSNTWLSEASAGVNFNPPGAPYQGATNTTSTDDYPPQLQGVIHVIGDSSSTVQLNANTYIKGTLIADCAVKTSAQTTLVQDPAVYAFPPTGYTTGNAMVEVGGTFKWDSLP